MSQLSLDGDPNQKNPQWVLASYGGELTGYMYELDFLKLTAIHRTNLVIFDIWQRF
ncbi:hypothetical protein [aff. Roholtiella sp. LEGE 12411]|uniref:hypothetical protein n=1 Tax=aff. Roholtiella sp. LEGE 12411 TaxID=1828822 RepID=UPI00187E54E3|nr:hypothetical protein [aff. Roholtiella sp. LEGE 12411]MBE9035381.1 hypothetical protein [aff. Roholtiella sp. LEGE 12411]